MDSPFRRSIHVVSYLARLVFYKYALKWRFTKLNNDFYLLLKGS